MTDDELVFTHMRQYSAEVYNFRFQYGWAIFTLCQETGSFSVESDWGNASYRWYSLGDETLKQALLRFDCHYIVNKFMEGTRSNSSFRRRPADKQSVFRGRILERRRGGGLSKAEARDLWDALLRFENDLIDAGPGIALERADDILWVFDSELYDIETEPSPRYTFWVEKLLPFFKDFLREQAGAGAVVA